MSLYAAHIYMHLKYVCLCMKTSDILRVKTASPRHFCVNGLYASVCVCMCACVRACVCVCVGLSQH